MDTATLLKLAQLLQAKPNAPSTLQAAGGRAVPNFGGAFSDTVRNLSTTKDINTLDQRQQAEQAEAGTQNRAAIDQFTAPTTPVSGQINDVDGGAPTPLAPGHVQDMVPANRDNQDLKAAFAGPDQLGQQALLSKMLLQRSNVPYGTQQVDALGRVRANNERQAGASTQGQTTILQIADRLKAASNGTLSDTDAIQQATVIARERYSNAEVAGVQGSRSGLTGAFTPNTSIEGVVANAGAVKEGEAVGTGLGQATAASITQQPLLEAQLKTTLENTDAFIRKAKGIRDNPALWRATGFLSYFPSIRGSAGANLDADIQSLRASTGLDGLTRIKQSGVTLGQVTEAEHSLLQDQIASLSQIQDDAAYKQQINTIIGTAQRMANAARREMLAKTQQPRPSMLPGATAPKPAAPAAGPAPISLDDYLKSKGF